MQNFDIYNEKQQILSDIERNLRDLISNIKKLPKSMSPNIYEDTNPTSLLKKYEILSKTLEENKKEIEKLLKSENYTEIKRLLRLSSFNEDEINQFLLDNGCGEKQFSCDRSRVKENKRAPKLTKGAAKNRIKKEKNFENREEQKDEIRKTSPKVTKKRGTSTQETTIKKEEKEEKFEKKEEVKEIVETKNEEKPRYVDNNVSLLDIYIETANKSKCYSISLHKVIEILTDKGKTQKQIKSFLEENCNKEVLESYNKRQELIQKNSERVLYLRKKHER